MNNNVVMLVGCSGVGKSSLGNRMFGLMPSYPSKPFRVDDPTVYPVAGTLQAFTGTRFSDQPRPGHTLTTVDTPGKRSLAREARKGNLFRSDTEIKRCVLLWCFPQAQFILATQA